MQPEGGGLSAEEAGERFGFAPSEVDEWVATSSRKRQPPGSRAGTAAAAGDAGADTGPPDKKRRAVRPWTDADKEALRAGVLAETSTEDLVASLERGEESILRQLREWEGVLTRPGPATALERAARTGIALAPILRWFSLHFRAKREATASATSSATASPS
jgi:hypothetical protein